MVAEFEADLIRSRTKEGMRIAKAMGHLRGKQPKLNPRQEAHLVELLRSGEYTTGELGDLCAGALLDVIRSVHPHPADLPGLIETAGIDGLLRRRTDQLSAGQSQRAPRPRVAGPSCSPPTTWKRPTPTPTGSSCCVPGVSPPTAHPGKSRPQPGSSVTSGSGRSMVPPTASGHSRA
ncbi:MAG: hypothetical protein ACRDOH_15075 [Streptosporangiaceae bacterium]